MWIDLSPLLLVFYDQKRDCMLQVHDGKHPKNDLASVA